MFKAITVYSIDASKEDVLENLVGGANSSLGIYRPKAGILYASCPHVKEKIEWILKGISKSFPGVQLAGCTVTGGFTGESGYRQKGFFLCLIVSDRVQIRAGIINNLSSITQNGGIDDVFNECTKKIVREDGPPAACVIFPAYSEVDGDRLIAGISRVLDHQCIIFGGFAADYWTEKDIANFSRKVPPTESSLQFFVKDSKVLVTSDSMTFLLINGPIEVEPGYSYGWSDMGIEYHARSEGNVLTELDGKDPYQFLREMNHPLASRSHDYLEYSFWVHTRGKKPYIRDIFFNAGKNAYYVKSGTLPPRFKISFSFPNADRVLGEYSQTLERYRGDHSLILLNTCCSHQAVLGSEVDKEHLFASSAFNRIPFLNAYVFGEFGSSSLQEKSALHSCSSVILCLREEDDDKQREESDISKFLQETILKQKEEIESLEHQLMFLESSKPNKMRMFAEDCLGILLQQSPRSLTAHAEVLSSELKKLYSENSAKPSYPLSRNRILDHLKMYKSNAEKKS